MGNNKILAIQFPGLGIPLDDVIAVDTSAPEFEMLLSSWGGWETFDERTTEPSLKKGLFRMTVSSDPTYDALQRGVWIDWYVSRGLVGVDPNPDERVDKWGSGVIISRADDRHAGTTTLTWRLQTYGGEAYSFWEDPQIAFPSHRKVHILPYIPRMLCTSTLKEYLTALGVPREQWRDVADNSIESFGETLTQDVDIRGGFASTGGLPFSVLHDGLNPPQGTVFHKGRQHTNLVETLLGDNATMVGALDDPRLEVNVPAPWERVTDKGHPWPKYTFKTTSERIDSNNVVQPLAPAQGNGFPDTYWDLHLGNACTLRTIHREAPSAMPLPNPPYHAAPSGEFSFTVAEWCYGGEETAIKNEGFAYYLPPTGIGRRVTVYVIEDSPNPWDGAEPIFKGFIDEYQTDLGEGLVTFQTVDALQTFKQSRNFPKYTARGVKQEDNLVADQPTNWRNKNSFEIAFHLDLTKEVGSYGEPELDTQWLYVDGWMFPREDITVPPNKRFWPESDSPRYIVTTTYDCPDDDNDRWRVLSVDEGGNSDQPHARRWKIMKPGVAAAGEGDFANYTVAAMPTAEMMANAPPPRRRRGTIADMIMREHDRLNPSVEEENEKPPLMFLWDTKFSDDTQPHYDLRTWGEVDYGIACDIWAPDGGGGKKPAEDIVCGLVNVPSYPARDEPTSWDTPAERLGWIEGNHTENYYVRRFQLSTYAYTLLHHAITHDKVEAAHVFYPTRPVARQDFLARNSHIEAASRIKVRGYNKSIFREYIVSISDIILQVLTSTGTYKPPISLNDTIVGNAPVDINPITGDMVGGTPKPQHGSNGPYDVLPAAFGLGVPLANIDLSTFERLTLRTSEGAVTGESIQNIYLRNTYMRFDDTADIMRWLEKNILHPYGLVVMVDGGKLSLSHADTLPVSNDEVFDTYGPGVELPPTLLPLEEALTDKDVGAASLMSAGHLSHSKSTNELTLNVSWESEDASVKHLYEDLAEHTSGRFALHTFDNISITQSAETHHQTPERSVAPNADDTTTSSMVSIPWISVSNWDLYPDNHPIYSIATHNFRAEAQFVADKHKEIRDAKIRRWGRGKPALNLTISPSYKHFNQVRPGRTIPIKLKNAVNLRGGKDVEGYMWIVSVVENISSGEREVVAYLVAGGEPVPPATNNLWSMLFSVANDQDGTGANEIAVDVEVPTENAKPLVGFEPSWGVRFLDEFGRELIKLSLQDVIFGGDVIVLQLQSMPNTLTQHAKWVMLAPLDEQVHTEIMRNNSFTRLPFTWVE